MQTAQAVGSGSPRQHVERSRRTGLTAGESPTMIVRPRYAGDCAGSAGGIGMATQAAASRPFATWSRCSKVPPFRQTLAPRAGRTQGPTFADRSGAVVSKWISETKKPGCNLRKAERTMRPVLDEASAWQAHGSEDSPISTRMTCTCCGGSRHPGVVIWRPTCATTSRPLR
jgi:hypothetical protein